MSKEIVYTEAAKKRLLALNEDLKLEIEDFLRGRKYVPGDDVIEITGADIDKVADRIFISKRANARSLVLDFASVVYGFIGVIFFFVGVFYDELFTLFSAANKTRLYFIVFGGTLAVFGFLFWFVNRYRELRFREDIRLRSENFKIEKFHESLPIDVNGPPERKR